MEYKTAGRALGHLALRGLTYYAPLKLASLVADWSGAEGTSNALDALAHWIPYSSLMFRGLNSQTGIPARPARNRLTRGIAAFGIGACLLTGAFEPTFNYLSKSSRQSQEQVESTQEKENLEDWTPETSPQELPQEETEEKQKNKSESTGAFWYLLAGAANMGVLPACRAGRARLRTRMEQ